MRSSLAIETRGGLIACRFRAMNDIKAATAANDRTAEAEARAWLDQIWAEIRRRDIATVESTHVESTPAIVDTVPAAKRKRRRRRKRAPVTEPERSGPEWTSDDAPGRSLFRTAALEAVLRHEIQRGAVLDTSRLTDGQFERAAAFAERILADGQPALTRAELQEYGDLCDVMRGEEAA